MVDTYSDNTERCMWVNCFYQDNTDEPPLFDDNAIDII